MSESLPKRGAVLAGPAGPCKERTERRKVMTNKRIHVSAIVLLIAAIIIDMHNNGLCPLSAPVPVRATKITGSFMVRGSVATWQRVAGTGHRIQGTVHGAVVDLKTTLRRLSQVLALPVKYATSSRRVYNCVWLCVRECVCLSASASVCVCRCLSITRCAMKSLLRIK